MSALSSREATAHHEAGHAVMAFHFRRRIRTVTIEADDEPGVLGYVQDHKRSRYNREACDPDDPWYMTRVATDVMISLAGPAAEERFTGERSKGDSSDIEDVDDLAGLICWGGEETLFVEWLKARVARVIATPDNWSRVCALAAALLETPRIGGAKARRICDAAAPGPMPRITNAPLR